MKVVRQKSPDSRYRELLGGLYEAVFICRSDGRILDTNVRAEEHFHYSRDELLAMNVCDVFPGLSQTKIEKILGYLKDRRFTVLNGKCVRKDGTIFPGETSVSRIQLADEGVLVFSITNIERRVKTEEMLRTEHNAIQNLASGVAITGPEGLLQYVNPTFLRLWGQRSENEVLKKNIRDFIPAGPKTDEMIESVLSGATRQTEMEVPRPGGKPFFVQVSIAPNIPQSPIFGSGTKVMGMVFSFIDITDRKRAEDVIYKEAQAQMKRVRDENSKFSGLLNILSIPDLIQLISSTQKSGGMVLTDDSNRRVADIAFANGQIVAARCESLTGEDAVLQLGRCGGVEFSFEPGEPKFRDASITRPTMALLLEMMRLMDEQA
ncbi:MAG TPA: PAS domain S-box protein [Kiritimatiellia bacterium]|nr:PAS domain S-box protein [Kiritimatiellia bacterium]